MPYLPIFKKPREFSYTLIEIIINNFFFFFKLTTCLIWQFSYHN